MGFFSGLAARNYFDNLIANRCVNVLGKDPAENWYYRKLSFSRHHEIFGTGQPGALGKDLLVCGSNFSTGTTQPFSYRPEHTPDFPVADAVRISMGFPVVYKPYTIKEKKKGWPPCGTYVDGGFYNNIPFREVDPGMQVKNTLAARRN